MHGIDYLIIFAYFVPVMYIGLRAKRSVHSSQDFFLRKVWNVRLSTQLDRVCSRDDLLRFGDGARLLRQ